MSDGGDRRAAARASSDSESTATDDLSVRIITIPDSSPSENDDGVSTLQPDEPPERLPIVVGKDIAVTKTKFTVTCDDSPRRCDRQQLNVLAFDLGPESTTTTISQSTLRASCSSEQTDDCSFVACNDGDDSRPIEYTLAIIKPEALNQRDAIKARIDEAGFSVTHERRVHLSSREMAQDFYLGQYGVARDDETQRLIDHLSSGPVIAMVLMRADAVEAWKRLAGPVGSDRRAARRTWPRSLRAQLGGDRALSSEPLVHASRDKKTARREIHFFFPDHEIDASPESRLNYYTREIKDTLLKGLHHIFTKSPANPVRELATWLLENNPNAPQFHCYFTPRGYDEDVAASFDF